MQLPATCSWSAIPGQRISDYRNSTPRTITLVGLGATAAGLVGAVDQHGMPNVAPVGISGPLVWSEIAGVQPEPNLDIIVIVCAECDAGLLPTAGRRPDVPVTLVLLTMRDRPATMKKGDFERARRCADLFVTTSDPDDVSELVANLAS